MERRKFLGIMGLGISGLVFVKPILPKVKERVAELSIEQKFKRAYDEGMRLYSGFWDEKFLFILCSEKDYREFNTYINAASRRIGSILGINRSNGMGFLPRISYNGIPLFMHKPYNDKPIMSAMSTYEYSEYLYGDLHFGCYNVVADSKKPLWRERIRNEKPERPITKKKIQVAYDSLKRLKRNG